ncbi:MAG: TROVE domain-containing protein, partial [Hymenobacter sp.]
ARLYLFDLAGLGTTPLDVRAEHGVALIAGWSDKVFDVLAALEKGESTLAEIEKTEL